MPMNAKTTLALLLVEFSVSRTCDGSKSESLYADDVDRVAQASDRILSRALAGSL